MMNKIYRIDAGGKSIVHIIGKLDSAKSLNEFLIEILTKHNNKHIDPTFNCSLIFDLTETELITEECLEILCDFKKRCSLEFKNCSLYVDLLLRDNGLLNENE